MSCIKEANQNWQASVAMGPQSLLPHPSNGSYGGQQKYALDFALNLHRNHRLYRAVTPYYEHNIPVPYDQTVIPPEHLYMYSNPLYPQGQNAAVLENPDIAEFYYDAVKRGVGDSEIVFSNYFVMGKIVAEVLDDRKSGISAFKMHTVYDGNDETSTRYQAELYAINHSQTVLSASEYETQCILAKYGEHIRSKIVEAPLGVDENILQLGLMSQELRRKVRNIELANLEGLLRNENNLDAADQLRNISQETLIFYCLARVVPYKRHRELYAAFQEFYSQHPDVDSRLLIAGPQDPKEKAYYDELMDDIANDESVIYVGGKPGYQIHAIGDVHVNLSVPTKETFSYVAAEGLVNASILTNGGPFPEVSGGHALLVDPTNPMDVAQAMSLTIEPTYRRLLSVKGGNYAQRYTAINNLLTSLYGMVKQGLIPEDSL